MPLDTENRRRAAGCHMCLSVPALPNVGLAAPDRPQLAWVYPELYQQPHPCDHIEVREALEATGGIMESLCAVVSTDESLAAVPAVGESLAVRPSAAETLDATPSARESLQASVTIALC